MIITVLQEQIPLEISGRVFRRISVGAFVAAPSGMLLVGYLVEYTSIILAIVIIAAGYLLVTVAQLFNKTLTAMNREED